MCFDDYLDLPSLTQIQANQNGIHGCMGYVILESMIWFDLIWFDLIWFDLIWFDLIWFDLIWFDLIRHSKSHWKQHSLRTIFIFIHCWFASNKYFSISFPFSRFRCSCSRKYHSKNVVLLEKLEKTAFLSLTKRRRRKLKFNLFVHSQTRFLFHFHCLIAAGLNQTGINLFLNKGRFWHPMKNRHPLKIEKSDKCHYNGLIRRYFTSLLLLTHSSRS